MLHIAGAIMIPIAIVVCVYGFIRWFTNDVAKLERKMFERWWGSKDKK